MSYMFDQKCGNCKFFKRMTSSWNWCRKNPPRIAQESWPGTDPDFWCGEWDASDEALIKKFPALKDAYDHYISVKAIITGEIEDD